MTRFIQLFEIQFSEDHILNGEAMLDDNTIIYSISKNKNQWCYIIENKNLQYEVEVLRKTGNKLDYSCSCDTYIKTNECSHIVLALFHLRKELLDQELTATKIKRKNRPVPRIKDLLSDSSKDEVHNFIQGYAKKDQKFKLFLQIYLINNCEIEEIAPLILSILSKIIKPKQKESDQIPKSRYRFLIQLINEIYTQSEDKIAIEQYAACFEIIHISIDKISYAISTYYHDNEILDLLDLFHKQISILLQSDIAPELRTNILDFIVDISQKSYYQFHTSYNNINILEQYKIKDLEVIKQLSDSITHKINKLHSKSTPSVSNIIAYLRITALGSFKIDHKTIKQFDHEHLYLAYYKMYKLEFYDAITYSINSIYKKETLLKSYTDLLVNTYQKLQNKEALNTLLLKSFFKYKDFLYYDKLKNLTNKTLWKSYTKQIKTILSSEHDISNLAQFFKKEEKIIPLAKLLMKNPSWELIQNYSSFLFEKDPLKLEKIYQIYISELMGTFFGTFASDKIKNLYQLISAKNNQLMLFKIKRFVIKSYPNRLIEN